MVNLDASIIIATYNRCDLLELSLCSFNFQNYSKDKFEVIVIDDGSTDETCNMIKSLDINYNLVFLRNGKNHGAAFARNIGLKNAKGNIIIFSDSDCIVPSNFISGHLKYHEANNNLCVSGTIKWKKVFSNYYKNFNTLQKKEFKETIENTPALKDKLKYINFNYDNDFKILSKDDVIKIDNYSYIPSWSDAFLGNIIELFGKDLKDFQYPWTLFGTCNVSIAKKYITDAGGFDERLIREEDWDLGYRLYKKGIKFVCAPELESCHQEHVLVNNRERKNLDANKIIFNKYTDYKLWLLCLFYDDTADIYNLSDVVLQYKILLQNRNKYKTVINKFHLLLKYRVNSFLENRTKSDRFMDISNDLSIINPISNELDLFIKIFKELSRIFL